MHSSFFRRRQWEDDGLSHRKNRPVEIFMESDKIAQDEVQVVWTPSTPTAKKPGPSLRRNSFSATELSTNHSSEDDRHSTLYENAAALESRRISWYAGIKEDSSESLSLTNPCDDDYDSNHSSTCANPCCLSSPQRQQQLLLSDSTKPIFYISRRRNGDSPTSPAYSRSFSSELFKKQKQESTPANGDRLAVVQFPRKASEPSALLQLINSPSPHFLRPTTLPLINSVDYHHSRPLNLQPINGFGYQSLITRHAHHRSSVSQGVGAHILGLSAYDDHLAKRSNTERVMEIQQPMKGALNHMQGLLDSAFALMCTNVERSIIEGAKLANEVLSKAWMTPRNGRNLAYRLCDYARDMGYLTLLIRFYCDNEASIAVREACGRALEKCTSSANRAYILAKGLLDDLVNSIKTFKDGEGLRIGVSLLETLFKDNGEVDARLIELEALDYVLDVCKKTVHESSTTFRHAALALVNLAMSSDSACQQAMIAKNVPEWLFYVASCNDVLPRYYACIAICALVSNKEIETAVIKSGTLSIVEPFLLSHQPSDFAQCDYRYSHGRPKEWLQRLVPMLNAKRREPRSVAAFHCALEAEIRQDNSQSLNVLEEIGAVEALKHVAALPEEVGPKFASQALQIIGEQVPYKLSQRVPEWTVEDVQYWVSKTGFEEYATAFGEQKVDGDLLLLLTEQELAHDIGMTSGLQRKRFLRELDNLKMIADYRTIDDSKLDNFLVSIHPRFSIYTYRLLEMGVDRSVLQCLNDDILKNDCLITNSAHRSILLQALEAQTNIDDVEVELLRKKIDIFISYRRSTGNQLASLIKVLLQLRGYKVFIDVERLPAGQFDTTLLKNIQAAKHFVLVLTQGALNRCVGDESCADWVHKEVLCALETHKNIIPVFDANFEFPDDQALPPDIRPLTKFNGLRWVHEYQDACVDKLEKFINGEGNDFGQVPLNRRSSMRGSNSKLPLCGSGGLISSASANDLLASHRSRTSSINGESNGHQHSVDRSHAARPDIIIDYCA